MLNTSKNTVIKSQNDQLEQLSQLIKSKIICKNHPNQQAKSICTDCMTFCCMIDSCGQPHIYHSIDNLEYLVNSQILPLLSNLKEVNINSSQNKSKNLNFLHDFKNNLKTFAVEEKKKIDEEYRKILHSLQTIYNSHMDDINEFIESLSVKFDVIQEKINTVYSGMSNNESSIAEINNTLNNLISKSPSNEVFISKIAKESKKMNIKIKEIHSQVTKFDFGKEIGEVKSEAEKEYPKIDRFEYFKNLSKKFETEVVVFFETKKKREEKRSISKMKRMVSMRQSLSPKDNYNLEIDLDIFVRYLFDEVNKIRMNPSEASKILNEYAADLFNNNDESMLGQNLNESSMISAYFNTKLSFINQYIYNLVNSKFSLPCYEWDNDLSNSAEDYLKLTGGKVERDQKLYLTHMKEVISTNYYSEYLNINSMHYNGSPELNKIIMSILLNEGCWDSNSQHNVLFDMNYNVMGICGVSGTQINKVILVVNFSLLKK